MGRGRAMKAKSVILNVLCAIAAVGWRFGWPSEHQARLTTGGGEPRLSDSSWTRWPVLAAENERLSNLVARASQSRSLSEDQLRELLRLRGEVGALRQQGKELETARRAAGSRSAGNQLSSQASRSRPLRLPRIIGPRDSWAFAGYASTRTPPCKLPSGPRTRVT